LVIGATDKAPASAVAAGIRHYLSIAERLPMNGAWALLADSLQWNRQWQASMAATTF
jgi:hypothetical protein